MLSRAASIKMKTARRPGWTENWPSINRWSAIHCTLIQRRKDAKTHSETTPISAGFRGYFAPSRLCAFALSQVAGLLLAAGICAAPAPWQPAQAPLMTRWAKDVKPYDTLREYPRPQLVRDQWMNLNGLWDFAIGPKGGPKQVRKPDQGIFYTATSGIWQTVWLEPVPVASIASVKVTPDVDGSRFLISVALRGAPADNFYLEATAVGEDGRQAGRVSGRAANELSLAIQTRGSGLRRRH